MKALAVPSAAAGADERRVLREAQAGVEELRDAQLRAVQAAKLLPLASKRLAQLRTAVAAARSALLSQGLSMQDIEDLA